MTASLAARVEAALRAGHDEAATQAAVHEARAAVATAVTLLREVSAALNQAATQLLQVDSDLAALERTAGEVKP